MVNGFFNVTSFSHFTMVNTSLICCISKSSRMKPKFMIAKQSEKAWFIKGLSKPCLLRWHLVMNFEKHFVTLLNLHTPTIYMCFLPSSRTRIFWLSVSSSGFLRLWTLVIFPWQKHDQISLHFFKPFLQSQTYPCHLPPSCLSSSPPSSSLL